MDWSKLNALAKLQIFQKLDLKTLVLFPVRDKNDIQLKRNVVREKKQNLMNQMLRKNKAVFHKNTDVTHEKLENQIQKNNIQNWRCCGVQSRTYEGRICTWCSYRQQKHNA